MRGYGDEFMEMNIEVEPDWDVPPDRQPALASDRGGGRLGFAGTVGKSSSAQAAGLSTLGENGFGTAPTVPMVPKSWQTDGDDEAGDLREDG
jgi:PPE-repeat protein